MDEQKPAKSYQKPTQHFSRQSGGGVVERRKRIREHNTISVSRSFRTHLESVPEALQSKSLKIIALSELAKSLGVEPKRLLPAIEHGYLKLVTPDPPTVYEPPPAAIEWLRVMFQPLVLRPFLSSAMVGELEGLAPEHVRKLCLDYGIPIYSDPVFGELMSISAFYRFHQQMYTHRAPSRFDRQALLWTLMHGQAEWTENVKPPRFSRRLELEIRRISALEEPAKTDAALRLWEAYRDGAGVAKCLAAARGKELDEPKSLKQLQRMLEVELPPESSPPQTPSQD